EVGELGNAAVGAHHCRIVVVAVEAEGEQLVDDGDRHARLEERVGQREWSSEATVELARNQRGRCIAATGEAYPLHVVGLAHVLQHLGLFLHEEVGADRDVGADPDLHPLLRDRGTAHEDGRANTHYCEKALRLHRVLPGMCLVPNSSRARAHPGWVESGYALDSCVSACPLLKTGTHFSGTC